jgi:hypothetical protein
LVTAGKVFKLAKATNLPGILSMLKDWRIEEEFAEADYKFTLVTEIMNLALGANTVTGVYSHDYVVHIFQRQGCSLATYC